MSFSSGPQQRHRKGEEDEGENEDGGGGMGRNEIPYIATNVCRCLYPS